MSLMTPPCRPPPICFGLNCQLNGIINIHQNGGLNLIWSKHPVENNKDGSVSFAEVCQKQGF